MRVRVDVPHDIATSMLLDGLPDGASCLFDAMPDDTRRTDDDGLLLRTSLYASAVIPITRHDLHQALDSTTKLMTGAGDDEDVVSKNTAPSQRSTMKLQCVVALAPHSCAMSNAPDVVWCAVAVAT